MECIERNELIYPKCPKCGRNFKPIAKQPKIGIEGIIKGYYEERLGCRYCKIIVNPSILRKRKDPIQFLQQFKKIPKNTEIQDETIEKIKEGIRLHEAHNENIRKYKHYPVPEKCIECSSTNIVASNSDYGWECLHCDSYFQWKRYTVIFHGDVEVDAENEDMAIELAYNLIGDDCKIDLEADTIGS